MTLSKLAVLAAALLLFTMHTIIAQAEPKKAEPTVLLVDGVKIQDLARKLAHENGIGISNPKYVSTIVDWLVREFGAQATGFAGMVVRSAATIWQDPTFENYHEACSNAEKERKKWYAENALDVPDGFGKIIHWPVTNNPDPKKWTGGPVKICTWIGNDQYYFEIGFNDPGLEQVDHSGNTLAPFPGTLDMSSTDIDWLDILTWVRDKGFRYKLHAKGTATYGSPPMEFLAAFRNGVDVGPNSTDPQFVNNSADNCFDVFFINPPSNPLPEQSSYCMGRCDARILNTGR